MAARKRARRRRPDRVDQYESPSYRDIQLRLVENVRAVRDERGWTQEEAAHQCEMSTRLLQRVEAGHVNLTLTTLARLSSGLRVDAVRLLRSVKK